jgi:nucleotide-binding universal stress UspA family protein
MYKKILVPLDGSRLAENVLPLARSFARSLPSQVELLAIVDIAERARQVAADWASITPAFAEDAARAFNEYLAKVAKNFPNGNLQCTVKQGNAAETIIAEAAADSDTLIAMATHGRSGLDRWLMGSVTEKVLRGASNPLMVVRAQDEKTPSWEMATLKRLVVPLDGSELAERIIPHVDALAKRLDLEVVLLGVYGSPVGAATPGEGFYNPAQLGAFVAELRAETVGYLAAKTEEMRSKGFKNISFVAKEGLEAEEIVSLAREKPDTLIAMCTHGRSGVKRWVLGSVTEKVVRHCGVPVLVVRAT